MPGPTVSTAEGPELRLEGVLDRSTVPEHHARIFPILGANRGATFRLDLGGVASMDSAGAAFCLVLKRRIARDRGRLLLGAASPAARDALSVFRVRLDADGTPPIAPGGFERLGEQLLAAWEGTILFAVLVVDTLHFTATGLFSRRHRIRGGAVVEQMVRIGLESLGIIALVSLLVGLVVALQSAAQLRQFGANIFIADLVGIAMTAEMGPLMTAILLAGRIGSATAAEIATMTITEEVDALKTMGIHPLRYLVVPRFLAITITQPLLTVVANLLGILGGFVIAVTYLDLSAGVFGHQLLDALRVKDLMTGLVKSIAFGWIIVFVGAHRGFQVRGGAEGVGLATTSSVVQAIFMVIAADAFFSLIFYFG
jgi:phospholipid/cholesterol/gamma-HCH transport system permease protein